MFGPDQGSRRPPKRELGKYQATTLPFPYTSLDQGSTFPKILFSLWYLWSLIYFWPLKSHGELVGWIYSEQREYEYRWMSLASTVVLALVGLADVGVGAIRFSPRAITVAGTLIFFQIY